MFATFVDGLRLIATPERIANEAAGAEAFSRHRRISKAPRVPSYQALLVFFGFSQCPLDRRHKPFQIGLFCLRFVLI